MRWDRFWLVMLVLLVGAPALAQERESTKEAIKEPKQKEVAATRKLPKKTTAETNKKTFALPSSTDKALTTVVTGLAIVLGLFLAFAWLTKKAAPKGSLALPGEVVEVLGRAPLNAKQQMQLVRLGNRLLLLAMSSDSAETLAEISDPAEVERLTAICRQNAPGSVTETFRQVLAEMGNSPARGGFIDSRDAGNSRLRAMI